jgi:hypothetical protein
VQSRAKQLCAFAGCVAFILLLALAGHPKLPADLTGSSTGMSAPSAPKAFVEAEPLAPILQSNFECFGQPVRLAVSPITLIAAKAESRSTQAAETASKRYPPLYRRPPPVLS